jgi:hypothetical protein
MEMLIMTVRNTKVSIFTSVTAFKKNSSVMLSLLEEAHLALLGFHYEKANLGPNLWAKRTIRYIKESC